MGQLLDLISTAKTNLFEPRFESYDPWDMAKNINPKMKDRTLLKRFEVISISFSKSVLGNLDPYYRTHTKKPIFGFFTINVLILISTVTIDAWLFCHVPWVIGFKSGLKRSILAKDN